MPTLPRAPTRNPRLDGWTPERRRAFLDNLAQGHSVGAALQAVGLSRQSLSQLRAREPAFDRACRVAKGTATDLLLPALVDRALTGGVTRHWAGRRLVHEERGLDVPLAIQLLRMQR